jgi:hypothetical protein
MISVATYQRWEFLGWLAANDPAYLREFEAIE